MTNYHQNIDPTPVSEGTQHGPIPPPEPNGDLAEYWRNVDLYNEDPVAYQYHKMRENLIKDRNLGSIDDERFQANYNRLGRVLEMRLVVRPIIEETVKRSPALGLARMRREK